MAITDIKKGIEARYTFYLEDYRMASVEGIPYDEFSKRVLQDSKGSTNYIGDEIGQHLEYNDIFMPDFLTKQMINRIRFKFTQSDLLRPRRIMKRPCRQRYYCRYHPLLSF